MGLEQVEIHEIVGRAVASKLAIPEFQREFVWDAQKASSRSFGIVGGAHWRSS